VALSEKYLIGVQKMGLEHKKWRLVLIEYNTNDPGQAETIVRIKKKGNAPVVSAFSCYQQFPFGSFFFREISLSQQMTWW